MGRSDRSYRSSLGKFAGITAGAALASACWLPQAHADEAAVLEEVTVTAQRRTERLQDVPVAVTALSESELIDRGVRQAGDIVDAVPNLLLNLPYGPEAQPTFTLR
ncbi:MAG TPA: hypothetical protein VI195_07435, partial [Steroidobacteraceae bacterium]